MKQTKKQMLVQEIFKQVKVLMNQYDDSYTKESDAQIIDKIENSLVSGGNKGYAFHIAHNYKLYTVYICDGIDKIVEYVSLASISKNTYNLTGNFKFY